MGLPVTIRCECGVESSASLGQVVTCPCGRIYDTSGVPPASAAVLQASGKRFRAMARIGIPLVGAAWLVGWALAGVLVGLLVGAVVGVAWVLWVVPRFRSRYAEDVARAQSWSLEASSRVPGQRRR